MTKSGSLAMILLICASGAMASETDKKETPPQKEEVTCRAAPAAVSRPGKRRLCLTQAGWDKIAARYPEFGRATTTNPDDAKKQLQATPPTDGR